MQRRTLLAGAGASVLSPLSLALSGLPGAARAAAWPERPIRVVQGFAPGGNADTIARLVSGEMARGLGQTLVVEAVAGAGGTLASAAVARAPADGYTLLLATGGHAVTGALYDKLAYQPVASFQMVSTITYFPFLLLAGPDARWRHLTDMLAAARAKPESVAYGSAGVGSTHHLAGELLARLAGVKLMHVPYKGDAAALTALLGGEVPFIVVPVTAALPHLKTGKVRALAVTGAQRWAGMPELPTVAEQGVPGYDVRSWAGWMLPAGTPAPIVERLQQETQRALQQPTVRERLEAMGGEVRASTPQEMTALVGAEVQKWTQLVAEARISRL
ncbi:Bug family tripartite tricarboxylate transporter substrate binding protein [Ideonella livida]|uniref:Tripartite tricarboxylate transporter substrate binding protein n=1 Tax=Ideonella livida TaxID=2707176 RepID=A0A7C9TKZ2_9BURK|nr:tripartite tricarboxylate transporter substrate binding protein [Ideonella livida]NDY92858.1 tripartite tricarboxylate transporter substrate binding protein [Ideonella livida]